MNASEESKPVAASAVSSFSNSVPAEVLLQALLEHFPASVYFKDRESRFIAVSRMQAQSQGFARPADLIGKSDRDLYSAALARSAREDELRLMAGGEPCVDRLEKDVRPDGRVAWSLSSKAALHAPDGTVIGTFGISRDITEKVEQDAALEKANRELTVASQLAGMAEIAASVLHNVGNVLNSLNVSTDMATQGLRDLKLASLAKAVRLLHEHRVDLADFLSKDPKGQRLPELLTQLSDHLETERTRLLSELQSMQTNVDHIKEIVAMQQAYAHVGGPLELLDAASVMEDALRMNEAALKRHDVHVDREYRVVPKIRVQRAKVLQILVNLIRNAEQALEQGAPEAKRLTVRVGPGSAGWIQLVVADNGVGIASAQLERIFERGFTTRKDGHGFGLSSCVIAASELHGTLQVSSEGLEQGATFTLTLPIAE